MSGFERSNHALPGGDATAALNALKFALAHPLSNMPENLSGASRPSWARDTELSTMRRDTVMSELVTRRRAMLADAPPNEAAAWPWPPPGMPPMVNSLVASVVMVMVVMVMVHHFHHHHHHHHHLSGARRLWFRTGTAGGNVPLWEEDHQGEHSDQESDHHRQVCGDSSQVVAFLSCTIVLVRLIVVVIIHIMPRQTMHPPRMGM